MPSQLELSFDKLFKSGGKWKMQSAGCGCCSSSHVIDRNDVKGFIEDLQEAIKFCEQLLVEEPQFKETV